jgi:Ni/Co efflux regulator RcnB
LSFSAIKAADSSARINTHRNLQELIVMRWIGASVVVGALALAASALAASAMTATSAKAPATQQRHLDNESLGKATDFSAQRYHRHTHRHHDRGDRPHYRPHYSYGRPYGSTYYGRPDDYRPYPYAVPAPFTFGFGFGPFW